MHVYDCFYASSSDDLRVWVLCVLAVVSCLIALPISLHSLSTLFTNGNSQLSPCCSKSPQTFLPASPMSRILPFFKRTSISLVILHTLTLLTATIAQISQLSVFKKSSHVSDDKQHFTDSGDPISRNESYNRCCMGECSHYHRTMLYGYSIAITLWCFGQMCIYLFLFARYILFPPTKLNCFLFCFWVHPGFISR